MRLPAFWATKLLLVSLSVFRSICASVAWETGQEVYHALLMAKSSLKQGIVGLVNFYRHWDSYSPLQDRLFTIVYLQGRYKK